MTNKTYNQYCAIAHTLDLVGDRWTLLIVRNLLLGPRRFSDLMKGLPGVSTNILTERLKLLEEDTVVHTRYLPPPAASSVYELTERGYGLVDVLSALARWGSLTLGQPEAGQYIVPEAIGFMVMGVFRQPSNPSLQVLVDLHVMDPLMDAHFTVELSSEGVHLTDGIPAQPQLTLQLDLEHLSALSSGRSSLKQLVESGSARLQGDADLHRQLVNWVDGRT
jgi:DNA-binding HxlR family transcriptional regulator